MRTCCAPRASALIISTPSLNPPSTMIVSLPEATLTISSRTSMDPGISSSTLPPWFDTMIPSIPACMAISASRGFMIPFSIKGSFVAAFSSFSSLTLLGATAWFLIAMVLNTAASMSMPTASAPASSAALILLIISSLSSLGLKMGIPQPPADFIASSPILYFSGVAPSPTKAIVPASLHPKTTALL